jgi:hypothetical protein
MGNPRNVEPSNVDRITVVDVPFFKPLFTKLFEDKIVLIDKCLELLHVDLGTGPLFIESKLNYGNRTDI